MALAQDADALAHRGLGAQRAQQARHDVGAVAADPLELVERGDHRGVVAGRAPRLDLLDALVARGDALLGEVAQQRVLLERDLVDVDADHRPGALGDLLGAVDHRLGEDRPEEAALGELDDVAEVLDEAHAVEDPALEVVGQRLDVPRAAERVGDVGDAGLEPHDVLGAQAR